MNPPPYTSAEINQKVFSVVSLLSGIEISKLHMNLSINDDIAINSLDRVSLLMALEDEFSKSIAEDELQGIENLQDLINFVERKANTVSS